ncbi:LysR family transcriptional regulator [Alteribacillus bidgolensis]|uniref:DNA-binding transcriptional regulator, LysR family n=1 Tax=Alteribacillus bidgolensis TaxID=930129 RepID=A0A1G8I4P1_9BACI|nr:LysR family transcriptional regulator [Alteribacillus bidgolensis]SDI13909.1 DNA-binding transcriptional regulator, LysR family [Alteribacillus bidgolensis]
MRIQTFQLFCYVIEEGSISAAAKRAYLSQPAVTKKIRQLEEHYSTLLFDREHSTVVLTPAGERLYDHAKFIVKEYEQSVAAIEMLRGIQTQSLKIGSSYTLGEYVLPEIISAFQQESPSFQIHLSISNTPAVLADLEEENIDLAFVEGEVHNPEFDKKVIASDNIVLIVPPNHRWAEKKHIVPRELLNDRMIHRESTSASRQIVENHLFEKINLNQLENTLELSTTQAIKSAVQSGLGYGYVSRLAVRQELKAGLLYEVDVSGIHIQRPLWVASRVQRFAKDSISQFSDYVRHFLQKRSSIVS